MGQENIRILPLHTPSTAPAHIPTLLTSFIGREREVSAVHQLLREPSVRLLTLIGPGGVGKTRLSLAVAESLLPSFPNGIFFVPLAAIGDPLLLLPHLLERSSSSCVFLRSSSLSSVLKRSKPTFI